MKGLYCAPRHIGTRRVLSEDGTIRRETRFPIIPTVRWLSPALISRSAIPLNKTPRERCVKNSDYDCLDLTVLPDDYLPRTNYVPACDEDEYTRRTPKVPCRPKMATPKPSNVTDFYRVVNREMVSGTLERTFVASLMPKNVAGIHGGCHCFPIPARLRGFCGYFDVHSPGLLHQEHSDGSCPQFLA